MTRMQLYEFSHSVNRLLSLFTKWVCIIIQFLGLNASVTPPLVTQLVKTPKDVYIESRKTRFLATFREEEEEKQKDWNSNIDDVMKDANVLAEIMKESNNEYEKKWQARILIENTPRGTVIMFYDLYKRAFSYYCDQAVMPYEIMNAAAMKYVMMFNCRDLFVDSAILPPPPPPLVKIESENKKREDGKTYTMINDKQAFARFKTYNNATKKMGVLAKDDKTINCFLHLGGTRNWSPITKTKKPNPINGFKTDMMPGDNKTKKLSYLDFKKQTTASQ